MHASRAFGAVLLILATACAPFGRPEAEKATVPDELVLKRVDFSALADWPTSDTRAAFGAFVGSCRKLVARGDGDAFGGTAAYGAVSEWRGACDAALQLKPSSANEARQFFETWFQPAQAANRAEPVGLFTGYYEPELNGSRKAKGKFQTPLFTRPSDLVSVDLGAFRPALKGERVAGRVDQGKLVPYATRADIVGAGLRGRSTPIVYVDDATDAFFLQVQGSGRVKLKNGETIRVAYDGQNGHPYTAIGRILIERGEVKREEMSMQRIRRWLNDNPSKAAALMNENPSYVFFKELPIADPSLGADGAQGVALTPEASLAVDLRFHGLGAPMWVDANAPADVATVPDVPFHRLLIAQDTGGAIRGPVRGDVYWGAGARPESVAGRMAHKGTLFVLLPKSVAARLN
ncbi:MAG: murein transglycosylase A [Alphaproteobacteria bacterium]|nr:murein transglycosylase A [Alphaproteobacteria bacterium]